MQILHYTQHHILTILWFFQSPVKKKIKAGLIGMKNDYYISVQALLFKEQIGLLKKKQNPNNNKKTSPCEILPLRNTHLHTLYHIALHCIAQYLYTIICALIYVQQAHKPILTQKSTMT